MQPDYFAFLKIDPCDLHSAINLDILKLALQNCDNLCILSQTLSTMEHFLLSVTLAAYIKCKSSWSY